MGVLISRGRSATEVLRAGLFLLVFWPVASQADDWPERPIEIIVASRVGGALDNMARGLGRHLAPRIGVPVVVSNKPGGMTSIATEALLRRQPDGHALLVTVSSPYLIGSMLNLNVSYSLDDFVVLNDQWSSAVAIHVHRSLREHSLADLIDATRADPGRFSAGVFVQSGGHLAFLELLNLLDLSSEHFRIVYFDSGSQFRAALAGGHIDFAVMPLESVEPIENFVDTRAVFARDRQPGYENVPPIEEALGMPELDFVQAPKFVRSLLVASTFPLKNPERFQILVGHIEAIVRSEAFQAEMRKQTVGTDWLGPDASTARLVTSFRSLRKFAAADVYGN